MLYNDVAAKMVPNGWHNIIPLTIASQQKRPAVKWAAYQHEDIPLNTMRAWYRGRFGQMALTGMVFGPARRLVALDVDVTDEAVNDEITRRGYDFGIGTDYWRVGNAPKYMAFFKGDVRSQKLKGVEVFGSSGQVAIYGTHPTTKRAYTWPSKSIIDVTPNDLPEITQDQVSGWLDAIRPLLAERDTAGRAIPTGDDALKEALRKDGIDAAQRAIVNLSDGTRHPTLLIVSGWLVSKGYDAQEIATFVDNNFPNHLRRADWRDVYSRVEDMAATAIHNWFKKEEW